MDATEWVRRYADAEASRLRKGLDRGGSSGNARLERVNPSRVGKVRLLQEPFDAFGRSGNRALFQIAIHQDRFDFLRNGRLSRGVFDRVGLLRSP